MLTYQDFINKFPEFNTIDEDMFDEALEMAMCKFTARCGCSEKKYNNALSYLVAHILWFMGSGGSTAPIRDKASESLGGASVSYVSSSTGKYQVPFSDGFYNTSKYGQLFAFSARSCGYLGTII